MCHNHALFNVLGRQKFKSVFNDNKLLSKKYVDETDILARFEKVNDRDYCAIHCICCIHWIAIDHERFYDDSNQYAMLNFIKYNIQLTKLSPKDKQEKLTDK